MKKLLLLGCLFLSAYGAFAQTVTYGIKGGLNLTRLPAQATGFGSASLSNKYLAGVNVGGVVDIGFSSFSIQPGVFYTMKGGKSDASLNVSFGDQNFKGTFSAKTRLDYLEVPLNFLYKLPAGAGKVFFGAGPYLGYGLSGSATITSTANGQTQIQSADVKFGNGDNEVKRTDYGFNLLVGYELSRGITVDAGYGQSFASTSNSDNGKVKNEGFRFAVGYFFK